MSFKFENPEPIRYRMQPAIIKDAVQTQRDPAVTVAERQPVDLQPTAIPHIVTHAGRGRRRVKQLNCSGALQRGRGETKTQIRAIQFFMRVLKLRFSDRIPTKANLCFPGSPGIDGSNLWGLRKSSSS